MSFGTKLRRLRNESGMTQQQLADKIGVTRVAVTQWESDYSTPLMGKVQKIAGLFNVKVSDLIEQDSEDVEPSMVIDISDLSDEKREAVYQFIRFQRSLD